MSMAVPVLYQPIVRDDGVYVDGALLNNSPITERMDPETTLLFRLVARPLDFHSDGFQGYVSTVMYAPMQWIEAYKTRGFPHCVNVGSGSVTTFDFQAKRAALVAAILHGMVCMFRAAVAGRRAAKGP